MATSPGLNGESFGSCSPIHDSHRLHAANLLDRESANLAKGFTTRLLRSSILCSSTVLWRELDFPAR